MYSKITFLAALEFYSGAKLTQIRNYSDKLFVTYAHLKGRWKLT